ncbi:MAG: ATP-binding protein [Hyphomicrobiaceae bacterium]|nr:MAG: ATP-binding protein [Hyphomicrobiaceae bacterium]
MDEERKKTGRLASITTGVRQKPPRIIIYGVRGVGKSTFAAGASAPIFVPTEDGLGVLDVASFPVAKSFDELMGNLDSLLTEDHDYRTVVVDSLDWAEKLIHEQIRKDEGEGIFTNYGRGYVFAIAYFERLLKKLDELRDRKGMTIVVVAHTIVKRFQSPDVEAYDRWELDLHQKSASVCEEWADVLGFATQRVFTIKGDADDRVRGTGTGERLLLLEERPSHAAKNRYSLPYELPLEYKALAKEIVKSWKKGKEVKVEGEK